jgi:hypothetical protein
MPDDFAGATMTLTNPGGLGTVASVPRLMAGQGTHHRDRLDRLPARIRRDRRPTRSRALGIAKVMMITQHLRPPGHPGRRVGRIPQAPWNSLLQGEERFYEQIFASVSAWHRPLAPASAAGGTAQRDHDAPGGRRLDHRGPGGGPATVSSAHLAAVAAGMAPGQGVPDPRPPRGSTRSARQRAAGRRPRPRPDLAWARPRHHGHGFRPDVLRIAVPRRVAGRGASPAPGHLLRHHRLRGRAHRQPRGARLAAGSRSRRARIGGRSTPTRRVRSSTGSFRSEDSKRFLHKAYLGAEALLDRGSSTCIVPMLDGIDRPRGRGRAPATWSSAWRIAAASTCWSTPSVGRT